MTPAEWQREYSRKRRVIARETGGCQCCFKKQAEPGKSRCAACKTSNAVILRSLRARAVKAGMCSICRARKAQTDMRCCEHCCRWRARAALRWCDECLTVGDHRASCARKEAA